MMRIFLAMLAAAFLTGAPSTSLAEKHVEPVPVKKLDPELQERALAALEANIEMLRAGGLEDMGEVLISVPRNADDDCSGEGCKKRGGRCMCDPDENGDCPEGMHRPDNGRCVAKPAAAGVSGGGLTRPLQIMMP